jgi:SAM-dependent methyltransferase
MHHWSDPLQALDEIHRILAPGGQLVLFDLRRDSPRMFLWLVTFAQKVVVPAAIRDIGEPTGSLLASYTAAELEEWMGQSQFKEWRVEAGPVYAFAWARKTNQPPDLISLPA